MRVLVTGGSSLLGKALAESKPGPVELTSTWFTNYPGLPMLQLDICNPSQVAYVFEKAKPQVVIHCAAVGSVDYTETHFRETHHVNVGGTGHVLRAAQDAKARFVYISTNAVFDGTNPPYSETSECHPINRYGSIKREAELLVMQSNNWLVIRPFLLYGWPYPGGRQNWVTIIRQKLERGEPVQLVNDVYWQPTLALDVAHAIWALIEADKRDEIYHVASQERMTLYEFGRLVAETWGYDPDRIEPVGAEKFKHLAPRPKNTTYDLSKLEGLGLKLRNPRDGLKVMK